MSNELEKYIRDNPEGLDRKKPDPAVLGRILQQMGPKKEEKPAGILISFRLLKWAAASLLIMACGAAWWYFNRPAPAADITHVDTPEKQPVQQPVIDSAAPRVVDMVDEHIALRKKALVEQVKAKQSASFAGLYNMQSAASRMTAVTSIARRGNNGREVVDALVGILNKDPNANVRLAALEGLSRFYKETYVRKKLVASLSRQHDPIVLINLIDLLTRMRESAILSELEKMVNDQNTNKEVQDIAWSGILQLRPGITN